MASLVHSWDNTYAYFCKWINQICIVVITEVPAYTKTSPGKFFVQIVCQLMLSIVLGHKNPGTVSRDMYPRVLLGGELIKPEILKNAEIIFFAGTIWCSLHLNNILLLIFFHLKCPDFSVKVDIFAISTLSSSF